MSVENTLQDVIKHSLQEFLKSEEYAASVKKFLEDESNESYHIFRHYQNVITDYSNAKQSVQSCKDPEVRQTVQQCDSMSDIVEKLLLTIESRDECSICIEYLTERVRVLTCKHRFHDWCIEDWLNKSDTCPYCRSYVGC